MVYSSVLLVTALAVGPFSFLATPVSSSASPAVVPDFPNVTTYTVNYTDTNLTCLTIEMALQFDINGTLLNLTDAKVNSTCPKDTNATIIELHLIVNEKDNVTFIFERDPKDNSTQVSNITLVHIDDKGVNHTYLFNQSLFHANGLKGYVCKTQTVIPAFNETNVEARFRDVHVIHPFTLSPNQTVVTEDVVCLADDDMSDAIPLAVGIALIALVSIVLIAYCVGRRRSRRLAYQSV